MIQSFTLTDFRSYAGARLAMTAGPVVLHGPNGAGKTNLLEAISLLTPGKGLRGATAAEMGRREPGEATGRAWAVMIELDDETRLGTGVQTAGATRRIVRIDGETAPPGRLLDYLRPVWATPEQGPAVLGCARRTVEVLRPSGLRRRSRSRRQHIGL